jgi:diketogulonate reductase-like aldo/keto reductase
MSKAHWNRRELLAAAAALGVSPLTVLAQQASMTRRRIPAAENDTLPVIGLGTYDVFDVEGTPEQIAARREIVEILLEAGGSVIDTSPMYNRSERVIGEIIEDGVPRGPLFLATKVWVDGRDAGLAQMRESAALMNTGVIDLMQVHNLRDTELHMPTVRELKEDGFIRYSGLTHYRADALSALEAEMQFFKPDFIQINYSLAEHEADDHILPLAADMGIAVIVNRPFGSGSLFSAVRGQELPDWAGEFADSWGQFFLKFIVAHPAVTCAIPATSKPEHMRDNVQAGFGALPDVRTRRRMIDFVRGL